MIKIFVTIILIISCCKVFAFEINSVKLSCTTGTTCRELDSAFKSLTRKYTDVSHFKSIMKIYIANNGIKKISYSVLKKNNKNYLEIKASLRDKIVFIADPIFVGADEIELPSVLPIKVNDYFDMKKNQSTIELIKDIAREKGYPSTNISINTKKSKGGISLHTRIKLGQPTLVSRISVIANSQYLKKLTQQRFGHYLNSNFDLQSIKAEIEKTKKVFIQYGYYLSSISFKFKKIAKQKVSLYIEIKDVKNYTFYFDEGLFFSSENLKKTMENSFVGFRRELDVTGARQVIKDHYVEYGFLDVKIDVVKSEILDVNDEYASLYKFDIKEGIRKKVNELLIQGNSFFDSETIISDFYKTATSQAKENYYDFSYYEQFVEYLKEKYISAGYVNVFIDKPIVREVEGIFSILFRVKEGLRTSVSKFEINGISVAEKYELLESIQNKESGHFNPIAFKEDLQVITRFLQNKGYYFAEISNLQEQSLISYNTENTEVELRVDIDTGKKLIANEIIIIGNTKTRKILIKREISISKGDLLTNSKIQESQTNLIALGLFSSVQIRPVSQNTTDTDILIFVREKDFGLIELAPGVRSDLGFKMSAAINYNNIDGMNKRISFKGTINKRFELGSLDSRRRNESSSLIEYDATVNFAEDHIFYSDVDFSSSLSKSRKRFFAFDADIQRVSFGIAQDFTNWFKVGLRYQLETFSQFDATAEKNHGHFKIGSFTPSMTMDFRNRTINTSKGLLLQFSCEYANPQFGSQDNSELAINYYKFVNRNKFYIPMSESGVFAISTAYGIQENKPENQSDSHIPNIKVFRLTGADIVRGYEDSEINRLINKKDISDVEVDTRAYMVNIKLEPRFYLSDSTMLGVFYDAGRVFVDEFNESELRSSVGLSFKYLTPVGSLDFDYGIKLLREEDSDGTLDSPGRLHVSIGFF